MKTDEDEWRYSAKDLPPAKNKLLYAYRCFMKLFMHAFFGIGSIILAVVIFPIMRIFIHPQKRFKTAARHFVTLTFKMFTGFMRITGVMKMSVDDRETLKNLKSHIVVANHPSKLDVVVLISLIPNADCIVRGSLAKTVLAGVIRQLYIVNSKGTEEMMELSRESLETGTNLIVFPEGTRTPRHGTNAYKRGAAQIALKTGHDVLPIYIGGNDKYGLGKHDKIWSYNKTERYFYDIHVLDEIKISNYSSLESGIAARHLTDDMHKVIAAQAKEIDNREV